MTVTIGSTTITYNNNATGAVPGLGDGQTAGSNLYSGSRVYGTTYTNTTGKPIFVYISTSNYTGITFTINVNGQSQTVAPTGAASSCWMCFVVPNGHTYAVSQSGGPPTLNYWYECR